MTTTRANFEAGTDGNTVTAGVGNEYSSVLIGAGSALTYSNSHPARGLLGMKVTPVTGVATYAEANTFNSTSITDRFYIYVESLPTVSTGILTWRTAAGQCGNISLTATTGRIQIQNSAGSNMGTMAGSLVINTLYRIETQVFSSATVGTMLAQWYLGHSPTAIETMTPATNGAINTRGGNITTRRIGKIGAGTNTDLFYFDDDLAVDGSLTALGPSWADQAPVWRSTARHRAAAW